MNYHFKSFLCGDYFGDNSTNFNVEFCPNINLLYGRNLSGKSTLFTHFKSLASTKPIYAFPQIHDCDGDCFDKKNRFDNEFADVKLVFFENENLQFDNFNFNSASYYLLEHVFLHLKFQSDGILLKDKPIKYANLPLYLIKFINVAIQICSTKNDCILLWDDIGKEYSLNSQSMLLRTLYEVKPNLQLIATTNSFVMQNIPKMDRKITHRIQNFEKLFTKNIIPTFHSEDLGEHKHD